VHSVNLCALDGLARELYTYEGSGTLFTHEDYCRIERLGIDDFEEVERLIARGQREGYLKPRSPAEVARILLNGFGAEIGSHHFAGVCGLETEAFSADGVGEIVGLYTITRFKGEGVGGRLLARALEEARSLGLRYVFACTVDERAQAFFEREGFRRVGHREVPASKWTGYERQRLARLRVLRYDLA
jgi:amino-acid N-acetyltransferase